MSVDIFDSGIPKYQSPQDIYDGLCAMESGEEIGILSQMFADVSWDNQDYYYTEAGARLREKWDNLAYDGDWKMELAVWQLDGGETPDVIWLCLSDDDAAKRLGFKKIFCDELLGGMKNVYDEAAERYRDGMGETPAAWSYHEMSRLWAVTFAAVLPTARMILNPYGNFSRRVYDKARGIKLDAERQLIIEARAMLNAYDDFMFGLRSNQYLYDQQERMYQLKAAKLKSDYENAVKALLVTAQEQGVTLQLPNGASMLMLNGEASNDPD